MTKAVAKRAQRPIREIAKEIQEDIYKGNWSKGARLHAMPYLRAMSELDKLTDRYLLDSGKSIILYFLSNASTWRGETARRIKAELRGIVA